MLSMIWGNRIADGRNSKCKGPEATRTVPVGQKKSFGGQSIISEGKSV